MAMMERSIGIGGDTMARAGDGSEITVFDRELLAERDYWRSRLAHHREAAELRLDFPRGQHNSGKTGSFQLQVDRETCAQLERLTGGGPFLLYTTLMAVLKTCVFRSTGSSTVAIGSPARRRGAGRERPNLVAVVDEVDAGMSFRRLLLAVRQTLLDAYSRQDYPFPRLVQDLAAGEAAGRCPFFDLILASPDLHGEPLAVANDATITYERSGDELAGSISFRTDLFETPTIARFASHLLNLLGAALADPETSLADLPILAAAEHFQVLAAWNDTAGEFPRERALHELFEARAGEQPRAPAVRCAGVELCYGELEERANRLARLLRRTGVAEGSLVGFWIEGCVEVTVALLAILKAGGAYVPVEPSWPLERIRGIFTRLGVRHLVTEARQGRPVHELRRQLDRVVCVDVDEPEPAPELLDARVVRALWDHVAETATDRVTAAGFRSSYTGEPFTEAEVDQYRDRVLDLAEGAAGPGARVLEIGCGSGLILFSLAPRVAACVGLDPSPATQEKNRAAAHAAGLTNVEWVTGFADEIGGFAPGSFDLVLMASTVQFFPGPFYLRSVIAKALRLLAPGGSLLLTDVMDAGQKDDFRRSLEEFGSTHREQAARGRTGPGDELYLDEQFFHDLAGELPGAAEVAARYRGGEFRNELRYRFDVVLRHGPASEPPERRRQPAPPWLLTAWHAREMPATRLAPGETGSGGLAYIIHTSGSTGAPKGVMVRHQAAVQLIDWVNREFQVGPGDSLLLVSSLCFDLSVYDVFGMLAAGGVVEVPTLEDARDPELLAALLRRRGITFWDSAPAMLQQLVPWLGSEPDGALRLVFLSGDWIPLALTRQIAQAFPQSQMVSLGGATEAAIWSNFFLVGELDPRWVSVPYGRPIRNARYYVLDGRFRPSPVGVAGDLFIGGLCLACGYAGEPELTAEKFVPDPFDEEMGGRLYRTGDRARFMADGNIEFLGRVDQQVKIRGFRVELAEVEATLAQHPAVREVVALAREEAPSVKSLSAYVVPRPGMPPTAGELQRFVRERLPAYMVPSELTLIDAVPLTVHGKVDRASLLSRQGDRPGLESAYVSPRTPVEQLLARIWTDVLQRERIGVEDNFFELGGHSLKGTQVVSRVRDALGLELPLRLLFTSPTVAELARVVEGRMAATSESAAPAIVPLPRAVSQPSGGER